MHVGLCTWNDCFWVVPSLSEGFYTYVISSITLIVASMEHVGHSCNFPASVFGRNSNFIFSIHGVSLAIIAFGCSLVWMKDTQVICPILPLLNLFGSKRLSFSDKKPLGRKHCRLPVHYLWIGRRQCYLSTFGSSFWIAFIIILTFLFVIIAMHCLLNFPHHCHSFLSHKIITITAL